MISLEQRESPRGVMASNILHCLTAWGLPLSIICGQCYDDAGNMSESRSGCSAIVQQQST